MGNKIVTDLNLNQNEIQNVVLQNLAAAPSSAKAGQKFYNTVDNKEYVYNGTAWTTYISEATKGQASGVASLGTDGKVPTAQLPSYVDDVVDAYIVGSTPLASDWLSDTAGGTALTPETGKIYVILTAGTYLNKTYRWSGTTYVEVGSTPAQATETTAGIAKLYTDVTGTNTDGSVTQNAIKTALADKAGKFTATSPELTPASGVATWTITNTLATADVIVQVVDTADNAVVMTECAVTSASVVIKINSSATIAAGAYKAVIIG